MRNTGITNVVVIDSQLDHATGLLTLREGCPILVWHTNMVYQDLTTRLLLLTCLNTSTTICNAVELVQKKLLRLKSLTI
ncbi:MBL fold metallo-hydrolase [Psychrobacter proteolyticus]|uniref:MBL fold metallo-hydrolase n=1 Tax=Psychrobacter proteolyticus TaxID=147825 RepID=UPI000E0A8DAC